MFELSNTFISLPTELIDSEVNDWLKRLTELFEMDRGCLAQIDYANGDLVITHEWDRPGTPPLPGRIVKEMFPWLHERDT